MPIVDKETGTRVDEVAADIFRINTPLTHIPGGFSYNQYLIRDDEPMLFHTGPRKLFANTAKAISTVVPVEKLRYVGLSHYEADECGAINNFIAASPNATIFCSKVAAMTALNDQADRAPKVVVNGDTITTGKHTVQWLDTPHLPHGWECGYIFDKTTQTLFCGDLYTQPGFGETPVTTSDILGPSEAFRGKMDYFSHTRDVDMLIERLATLAPKTLACMHGSAWQGDGAALLRELGKSLKKAA